MYGRLGHVLLVASLALCAQARGQAANATSTPIDPVVPTIPNCCRVAAGTSVLVETVDRISTKSAKPGDRFALKLSQSVMVDGKVAIPAGAAGFGEVIDSAPGGMGGRPAKLILAARYVQYGEVRIALHALRLGGLGENNKDLAMSLAATPYAGVLALAIQGGNLDYPPGTRAIAKLAADITVPPAEAPPAPVPSNSSPAP